MQNQISKQQYGYQKDKSAEMCLNDFGNFVNAQLNCQNNVLILFVDFSKAFDILLHRIILTQLSKMGINGMEKNGLKIT